MLGIFYGSNDVCSSSFCGMDCNAVFCRKRKKTGVSGSGDYGIDFTLSTISAANLGQKIRRLEELLCEYSEAIQKSRIYTSAEEWMEKLESYTGAFTRKNIQEK